MSAPELNGSFALQNLAKAHGWSALSIFQASLGLSALGLANVLTMNEAHFAEEEKVRLQRMLEDIATVLATYNLVDPIDNPEVVSDLPSDTVEKMKEFLNLKPPTKNQVN